MKCRLSIEITFLAALLAACEGSPIRSSYQPVLPELPRYWEEILGEPHWRLEWVDEGGCWQEMDITSGRGVPELPLIQTWTTAVLAWPFWPSWDLLPGIMRPCGALFPWDAIEGKLILGWKAGVESFFWKEMAAADFSSAAARGRFPWYFDWPRFRDLLYYESGNIPELVRRDPWLADWKSIAQRTIQSGFDRRRIVSRNFTELSIPGLGGRWIGSSPFLAPIDVPSGGSLLLPVTDVPDTWISSGGILRCSTAGWVWRAK